MSKQNLKQKINWWILPAIACGIVAVVMAIIYINTVNIALVLILLPAIAGCGFSVYKMMGYGNLSFKGISEIGPVTGDINAFCIYGKIVNAEHLAEKVQFENLAQDKLFGDRWYFEDLNKWLYVLFNDLADEGNMKAFELPDSAYTDPARLSIQLNMGRVNEWFQLEPSLFDQLKPWIMFAVITVIGFLIFLSGSG